MAEPEFQTEFLEWDDFRRKFRWGQGQHATFIAPTQAGKTTIALELVNSYRRHVIALATKGKDPRLSKLKKEGYRVIRSVRELVWEYEKHLLWPRPKGLADNDRFYQFYAALDMVYRAGHVCLFADELTYLTDDLRLKREWQTLLREGYTNKVTMISLSQRPAWVPRECYSQAFHIFFARTTDRTDLDRISDITGSIDRRVVRHDVRILRPYEWLWIDRFKGTAYRIRMPKELVK